MLKWTKGRQDSGYYKMKLLSMFNFDCYLLKFPVGSHIIYHMDPVKEGLKHYRLNLILNKSFKGGEFECSDMIINLPRIKLFRPDVNIHSLSTITSGTRYVLSVGWVIKE